MQNQTPLERFIHYKADIGLLGCKAIPMEYAPHFLEMLIEQYQALKNPNETFEHFYDRLLSKYSFGALAFLLSYNFRIEKEHQLPQYKLNLSKKPKTKGHEAFEIFDFGEKIYRSIHGESPYKLVSNFAPDPSQKSVTVEKNRLPQKLEGIVNNMLKADKTRAKVFSELLVELNLF